MIKYDVLTPASYFVAKYDPTRPNSMSNLPIDKKTDWDRGVLEADMVLCTGVKRRTVEQVTKLGLSPEFAGDVSIDAVTKKLVGSGKMIFTFKADYKADKWVPNSKHHMKYPSNFYVVWRAPAGTEFWSKGGVVGASELAFPYIVETSDILGLFNVPGIGGVYPPIDT